MALRIPICALLVASLAGCAPSERVEFLSSQCVPVREGDQLKSITFQSSIQTNGLLDSQLLYRVRLVDAQSRPVKSHNGRFEDSSGAVAGSKTLMVMQSPKIFKDVQVSIPATELEIQPDQLPVYADFGVFLIDGQQVARAVQPIRFLAADPVNQFAIATMGDQTHAANSPQSDTRPDDEIRQQPAPDQVPPPDMPENEQTSPYRWDELFDSPEQSTPVADQWQEDGTRNPQAADAEASPKGAQSQADDASMASATNNAPPPAGMTENNNSSKHFPDRELGNESPEVGAEMPSERHQAEDPPQRKEAPDDPYRLYTVQKGDTLTRIAWQQLNDSKRWREIYELNKAALNSPHWLQVGMELRLPKSAQEP
jgi:hypothetical protein